MRKASSERAALARLRARLPERAFARRPNKCSYAAIQLSLLAAVLALGQNTDDRRLLFGLSIVAGHCLFCLALFAHELSHGSVLRAGALRRGLELVCWGLNLISPTVWHAVHNRSHHRHASTAEDPDRPFLLAERGPATRLYTLLFYPGAQGSRWNPLVYFHFLPYVAKHTLAALLGAGRPLACVPARANFSGSEQGRIVLELVLVGAIQGVEFAVLGRFERYVWLGLLPLFWSSTFVMAYVFTHHFLRPLTTRADPVLGTTSVAVPPLFDRLHLNFSYHTEHHCFPSMDSRYAPVLSALLATRFGSTYQRLCFRAAWSLLWRRAPFAAAPAMHGARGAEDGQTLSD
jgi:fatty acid desaturase